MNELPKVAVQPKDSTVVLGSPVSFAVSAAGTGPFFYKWRKDGDIAVADTNAVFKLAPTLAAHDGAFWYCTVSNAFGSVVSLTAVLTLRYPVKIVRPPSGIAIAVGVTACFSVSASLSEDSVFTIDSVQPLDNGWFYSVIVFNTYRAVTSREAGLTVVTCDRMFRVKPESLTVDEGRRHHQGADFPGRRHLALERPGQGPYARLAGVIALGSRRESRKDRPG